MAPSQCYECGVQLNQAGQPDTDESEIVPGRCTYCITMQSTDDDLYEDR